MKPGRNEMTSEGCTAGSVAMSADSRTTAAAGMSPLGVSPRSGVTTISVLNRGLWFVAGVV